LDIISFIRALGSGGKVDQKHQAERELMMSNESSNSSVRFLCFITAVQTVVIIALGCVLVFSLLPKAERGVQVAERIEARFQAFADEVQPVVSAGAGKAIEAVRKMDADKLGATATEAVDTTIGAAKDRVKKFIDGKKKESESSKE
jgi:hypothetical protein